MPGNTVRINDSSELEWYVGDSKMEGLIKWLNENGAASEQTKESAASVEPEDEFFKVGPVFAIDVHESEEEKKRGIMNVELVAGTQILTIDGYRPIEDIKPVLRDLDRNVLGRWKSDEEFLAWREKYPDEDESNNPVHGRGKSRVHVGIEDLGPNHLEIVFDVDPRTGCPARDLIAAAYRSLRKDGIKACMRTIEVDPFWSVSLNGGKVAEILREKGGIE